MRIFLTGASGFIGSAIVTELTGAGHTVLGLARNDASAAKLEARGIDVQRGDLNDPEGLADAARACDGVIHTAFIHDFSNLADSGKVDLAAIEAFGDALAGTGKPLVVTSGTAFLPGGRLSTEDDVPGPDAPVRHRIPSDEATLALAARGVRSCLLRLPPSVHGDGDHGFVPFIIAAARKNGVSAYIGDGQNRWPAVHRLDAARLFRLAAEKGEPGARYHGIGDQGVPTREIAEVIGQRLNLPVVSQTPAEAAEHFDWIARFFAIDCPSSSALTQERLGWSPSHVGLLDDLREGTYFDA